MSEEPESIPLRLHWRQTWPEKQADFVAEAPGYDGSVGRIYLHSTGGFQNGRWFWAFQASGDEISRNIGETTGYEDSARAAARRVENAWFTAIRGSRLDIAPPPEPRANAYAAAKGR